MKGFSERWMSGSEINRNYVGLGQNYCQNEEKFPSKFKISEKISFYDFLGFFFFVFIT